MRRLTLVVAAAALLGMGGCAQNSQMSGVNDARLAALSSAQQQPVFAAQHNLLVAESNLERAQRNLEDAERFSQVADKEYDAARAELARAQAQHRYGEQRRSQVLQSEANSEETLAQMHIDVATAQQAYARAAIDYGQREIDAQKSARQYAAVELELVKSNTLWRNGIAPQANLSDLQAKSTEYRLKTRDLMQRAEAARVTTDSRRTQWTALRRHYQASLRTPMAPSAPPPPAQLPYEQVPAPSGGPNGALGIQGHTLLAQAAMLQAGTPAWDPSPAYNTPGGPTSVTPGTAPSGAASAPTPQAGAVPVEPNPAQNQVAPPAAEPNMQTPTSNTPVVAPQVVSPSEPSAPRTPVQQPSNPPTPGFPSQGNHGTPLNPNVP